VIVSAYDLGKLWTAAARWRYASGYVLADDRSRVYDVLTNTSQYLFPGRERPPAAVPRARSQDLEGVRRSGTGASRRTSTCRTSTTGRVPEPAISGLTSRARSTRTGSSRFRSSACRGTSVRTRAACRDRHTSPEIRRRVTRRAPVRVTHRRCPVHRSTPSAAFRPWSGSIRSSSWRAKQSPRAPVHGRSIRRRTTCSRRRSSP
jgi:hypothetical protein